MAKGSDSAWGRDFLSGDMGTRENTWTYSPFDCFVDPKTCLCGYFCMPCQLRQNAGRLGEPAILFCLLHCFVPCLSLTMLRGKARNKYRIEGDVCEDAVVSWFCPCCTNVQIANEIKFRNA